MRQSLFGRSIVGRAMEILLIEDDLIDAHDAMQVLDRGHVRCRVSLVRDGEEAMAFIHRRGIFAKAPRPDLILLDVQLPKKSGCEVFREVQADETLKKIPVVVMSYGRDLPDASARRVLCRAGIHAQAAGCRALRGHGQVAPLFALDRTGGGLAGLNLRAGLQRFDRVTANGISSDFFPPVG